jgi:hypothetical protein
MRYFRFLFCAGVVVAVVTVSLSAQFFDHPLTLRGGDSILYVPKPEVPDTLRVLAIMVQFQSDDDSRTTGNGQFNLSDGPADILNPPPHDADYFGYHLEFTRRYFERISGGALRIEYTVWDRIFTLPEVMGTYSPRRDGDFGEIGRLFEDAWLQAAQESPEIPFNEFDTFIIFHAGVGRDIDLTGIYGFDPTPLDIPSLYLGEHSLRRIFGDEYRGLEVGPEGFRITNTMILPETQNRELDLITGRQLLQLGMNGLVCAMFGSRLGLPDLFNTDTGRSGIGRFGLMDGQSIFSFSGLFPPELSAWEKYYLGWIEPYDVQPGEHTFTLPAVSLREPNSILRVPINAREYYLVENRHRNPFGNGQTLTLVRNGTEESFRVERDRTGFNAFDISDISGVVLDAEVYDWSVPGGYVEVDEIFYDGGIIIWHIDERIIGARIGENRINADIENRGVRVVEADGSQDIGRQYEFLQPGQGSEDGTQFDFWYAGNPVPVYENRFDANSIPASKSNTGAPSHIAVYDFSERAPGMELRVTVGSETVSLLPNFPVPLNEPGQIASVSSFPGGMLIVDEGMMKVIDFNGELISTQDPAEGNVTGTPTWYATGDTIHLYTRIDDDGIAYWRSYIGDAGNYDFQLIRQYQIGEAITAGPVLLRTDELAWVEGDIAFGTDRGNVYLLTKNHGSDIVNSMRNDRVQTLLVFDLGLWVAVGERKWMSNELEWEFPGIVRRVVGIKEDGGRYVYGFGDDELYRLTLYADEPAQSIPVPSLAEGEWGRPIAHDVNRDGRADILITKGTMLYAFNANGSVLDYFPVPIGEQSLEDSYPVAADFNSDQITETAVGNNRDLLRFVRNDGREAEGTPLAVGERIIGSPLVVPYDGRVAMAFITADNLLYAYSFDGTLSADTFQWSEEGRDKRRSNVYEQVFGRQPISDEFLPEDRAYNWPNPVYDGLTNIRYYLSENADVTIGIYEMTGEKVTEFDGPGIGGTDNEVRWDAGNVQSGIYLGRIEARSENQSKVLFIKIAVVR